MMLRNTALTAPTFNMLRDILGHDACHGDRQEAVKTLVDGADTFVLSCSNRPTAVDRRTADPIARPARHRRSGLRCLEARGPGFQRTRTRAGSSMNSIGG